MKTPPLSRIAKDAERIGQLLSAIELIPVGELARKWGTTKDYVRRNMPIVKLGPKTHRVRAEDAANFIARRTTNI